MLITSMRLTEIERAICEKDPPLPSQTLRSENSLSSQTIAQARGVTPNRLRRTLSGDLDNIVLKAMRKEPGRRYASAQQMASDIQRYLDGKPVIAHPDTLSYRSAKFVRRHWLPVTAGICAALLVMAFAATTYTQSRRIAAERDRVAQQRELAEHERTRAQEISGFLINLFKLSDPEENRGNQVTARELLDSGATRLRAGLQDQPATRAALLSTVGTVYDSLGQYRDALPLLNEALQLQEQSHDNAQVETLLELGRAYIGAGDLAAAEAPLQQALHLAQSDSGPKSVATGQALWTLGMLRFQQGRVSQAKELYVQSLAILQSSKAPETDVSPVLSDLATAYMSDQQWTLAKAGLRAGSGNRSTRARRRSPQGGVPSAESGDRGAE